MSRPRSRSSYSYTALMALDHERLEVYHIALAFFDLIDSVIEQLPRGRGHQLSRADYSVVNNIAEG